MTLAGTGPATAAFYRCVLAVPVLVVLAAAERRRCGRRRAAAHAGAFVAGLFFSVDLVLWNHAIAEVGAGIATVLGNLQVLFVIVIAWVVLRERPGRRVLIALPAVLGGVVLVSGLAGSSMTGTHPLAGVGYGFGTSAAYAVFLLIMRRASAGSAHVAGPLAEASTGAAAGAALLGVTFGGFSLHVSWPSLGWLLVLALTSQTVGWLLITSSLPRLPAAISSLTLLLQPAAAIVLAAAVLGERPTLLQIGGAIVVCGGVLAVARSPGSTSPGARPRGRAGPEHQPRQAAAVISADAAHRAGVPPAP